MNILSPYKACGPWCVPEDVRQSDQELSNYAKFWRERESRIFYGIQRMVMSLYYKTEDDDLHLNYHTIQNTLLHNDKYSNGQQPSLSQNP
jgi:hypothetical protein